MSRGVSVQEGLCPGGSIQGVSVQGVSYKGVSVQRGFVQVGLCPGESYWNAFSFTRFFFLQNVNKSICTKMSKTRLLLFLKDIY